MSYKKSYTDLQQSKKLAEILPHESADMVYAYSYSVNEHTTYPYQLSSSKNFDVYKDDIPCWSLAALLGVLPSASLDSSDDHHYRVHCKRRYTKWYDNPIDACVEMILKLNELKML